MSKFTVRVELFGRASNDDYESLHEKMQAEYYFRVVKGDGQWYHLPSATYTAEKNKATAAVRSEVFEIAKSVWTDPGVFVTEANNGRYWKGLRKASTQEVENLTS